MNERDDGGPAFPVNEHFDERRGEVTQYANAGMSLRDHFAGEALKSLVPLTNGERIAKVFETLNQRRDTGETNATPQEYFAQVAYALANAMIKERAK